MKKKILCLAMAAIMAVGIHTTAFAETLQGGSDWKVEFNGSKMSSIKISGRQPEHRRGRRIWLQADLCGTG